MMRGIVTDAAGGETAIIASHACALPAAVKVTFPVAPAVACTRVATTARSASTTYCVHPPGSDHVLPAFEAPRTTSRLSSEVVVSDTVWVAPEALTTPV